MSIVSKFFWEFQFVKYYEEKLFVFLFLILLGFHGFFIIQLRGAQPT